jgi:hypothetical protein
MRGAGLSVEVGELDIEEGSTTMVVLDGVDGNTTVVVLGGVEGMVTYSKLNISNHGTGQSIALTNFTMKHKNGSIQSKSTIYELNLTHLW